MAGVKTKLPAHLATRLYRVTELFDTGRALVLDDSNPDDPVVVWVQKLNSFQRQDALKDAEYGRSRRMATLTESTEEIQGVRLRLIDYDDDRLIKNILGPRSNEFWAAARDDVTAEDKWEDTLAALRDHEEAMLDGSYIPAEEQERVNKLAGSYLEAVTKAMEQRTQDAVHELKQKTRKELDDEYVQSYRQLKGAEAWQDEYNRTEVWYALRDCRPAQGQDPAEHAVHEHPQLLERRGLVYELPDELIDRVQQAIRDLTMPASEAGNSVAPRSSSVSSERQDTAEASAASTPEGTSTAPDGTSSTPSTPLSPSSDG